MPVPDGTVIHSTAAAQSSSSRDCHSARADVRPTEGRAQAWPTSREGDIKRHQRALPHGGVACAIEAVRASEASLAARLAFEFLVLTACRSGEVRLARWDEIDLEARDGPSPVSA